MELYINAEHISSSYGKCPLPNVICVPAESNLKHIITRTSPGETIFEVHYLYWHHCVVGMWYGNGYTLYVVYKCSAHTITNIRVA